MGEGLGQRELSSPLVVDWQGEGEGDADMCQVERGRDVLRIIGAQIRVGRGQSVIREASGRRCPQSRLSSDKYGYARGNLGRGKKELEDGPDPKRHHRGTPG